MPVCELQGRALSEPAAAVLRHLQSRAGRNGCAESTGSDLEREAGLDLLGLARALMELGRERLVATVIISGDRVSCRLVGI